MQIRPVTNNDIDRIAEIVRKVGNFNQVEIDTAMELVHAAVKDPKASGYLASVVEDNGAVQGYVCYGPVPLTEGTYDLYWIAVDPATQGKGYGKALVRFTEQDVRERGGRLLVIETSSQESYGSTVKFYEKTHYELAANLKEYYRPGDDKLIFIKKLR